MTIPHPPHAGGAGGAHPLPKPRWQQRIDKAKAQKKQMAAMPGFAGAPPQAPTVGDCLGLCLPVEFPDVPASIPRDDIHAYSNHPCYSG